MDPKKSKPVTTSVPSISIKFHANAEQIEEFSFNDDNGSNCDDKAVNINPASSSSDQDSSPLKLFPKLVKRSTSIDVTANQNFSSSPPSDPWRFFTDIKGKITKSVEEKITEIKARQEEGSPLHKSKTDAKTIKKTKTGEKDSSSFSDSEDQSESSISRTCGFASTTEGVEMSSDDETSSIDKKVQSTGAIRQRFKFLKHHSHRSPTREGSVNINHLSKLYNINAENVEQALPEHTDDVESAVDALEETDFKRESPIKSVSKEDIIQKVAEKIDNIEVDPVENIVKITQTSGADLQKSFTTGSGAMSTVFAPTGFVDVRSTYGLSSTDSSVLPYVLLSIYIVVYAILHAYLPYMAGLILGASLSLILGYVYIKLYTSIFNTPVGKRAINGNGKIREIPAIKEHQPLSKFEGWMNEYPDVYDPLTYHITQTQSVFLRLQGNLLRISHSKTKVPKRAMWNEQKIKASFTHHRVYNLVDAKVTLLPDGLTKIRMWSKKYPICITLSRDQMNFDPAVLKLDADDKEEQLADKPSGKSPKSKKKFLFKRKEYPYMAQRFSKLAEDQDVDFDSDSRTSTPSPETPEAQPEISNTKNVEAPQDDDDMHSLPDDWSECSQNDNQCEIKIYLFGRTDREKENWFRRLANATHLIETGSGSDNRNSETEEKIEMEYLRYMLLFNKVSKKLISKEKNDTNNESTEKRTSSEELDDLKPDNQLWFNALVGRVLFDCMRDPDFTKKVQNRIQRKLQTVKLPYFIEEILITELNLGKMPPFVLRTEKPVLDDRGLWVDLDVSYEGSIVVTLQTKLNLMKLKNPHNDEPLGEIKSAIYHSDVDDSAESSTDEEGPQEVPSTVKEGVTTSDRYPDHGRRRFIKMVDRIAESKFFQVATDNRYIKKAMEGVSNTELRLTVELKALSGTVVLNIPPPPSDRIWVGFRPVPELILAACPIVGDRNVTYTMVTSWIEKKILAEFQKVMVIPNMEDFLVPVMDSKLP